MLLHSKAFANGSAIPRRYSCDGEDVSPELNWSGAPAGARSYALLCDDPDAPGGTWHHWAAYDIPASVRQLPEGASRQDEGLKQAITDFQRVGYGGPCPPHRHGAHHYHFRLLALSVDHLSLGDRPSCLDVEREARKTMLTEAVLIGTYER